MKRYFKVLFIMLIGLFFIPYKVSAAGSVVVSPTSVNIMKGASASVAITANNVQGRINISSSNTGVATVSVDKLWIEGNTQYITITGISGGNATIAIEYYDISTIDTVEEVTGGQTIYVTVNEPAPPPSPSPVPQPSPSPSPVPQPSPSPRPQPSPSLRPQPSIAPQPQPSSKPVPSTPKPSQKPANPTPSAKPNNTKSSNANIKKITADGYIVKKVDDNNYTVIVGDGAEKINLKAETQDSKAKVSGTGALNLKVGLNTFKLTVTAEDGTTNVINLNITRKEAYKVSDLEVALKEPDITNIDVNITNADNILSTDLLNSIKDSGKKVTFNYYDTNSTLAFSFVVDGNSIDEAMPVELMVYYSSEYSSQISKLSDGATGKYAHLASSNFPNGTKVRLYVGDQFKDGSKIDAFTYNNREEKLNLLKKATIVRDGFIEVDATSFDYFLTISKAKKTDSLLFVFIGGGIFLLLLLILIVVLILANKKKKNDYGGMSRRMVPINASAKAAAPQLVNLNTASTNTNPADSTANDVTSAQASSSSSDATPSTEPANQPSPFDAPTTPVEAQPNPFQVIPTKTQQNVANTSESTTQSTEVARPELVNLITTVPPEATSATGGVEHVALPDTQNATPASDVGSQHFNLNSNNKFLF